jgi:hypothetical protein
MAKNPQDLLGDRRKALEEEFFRKQNEKLRERLHAQMERKDHRESLALAIGIRDAAVLDHLVALGLDGQTVAALGLVPLIEVAWHASGASTTPAPQGCCSTAGSRTRHPLGSSRCGRST